MSLRNIITLLVATSLLATAVAPGAAACADPHCPWSPATMLVKEVVDSCTPLSDCVRDLGIIVGDAIDYVGATLVRLICDNIGC